MVTLFKIEFLDRSIYYIFSLTYFEVIILAPDHVKMSPVSHTVEANRCEWDPHFHVIIFLESSEHYLILPFLNLVKLSLT